MPAWSEGYFTDIQYTAKAYPELAPGFLAFACLRQGVRPPAFGPGSNYLELGCGQGFGLNLLAAANPGANFWGIDFHPGQIDNALRQAAQAGLANVAYEDLSFEQLLAQPPANLPKFEVIALHGVYAWVSDANRAAIVQILDRLLKPGGLAYVSYNCLPGWAKLAPIQRFVADHVARNPGAPETQVIAAFKAAQQLIEAKAAYFAAAPELAKVIEDALQAKPAYLVHEYLNEHSRPLYHADVVRDLAGARLWYAGTANFAEDLIHLAAPESMRQTIAETPDRIWRETLLDYASNKTFRRDIFVRGRNALSAFERDALLADLRFVLLTPPDAVVTEYPVPVGRVGGHPKVYGPIIEALATGPKTYAEIRALPALADARDVAVLQALGLLTGWRQIHLVPAEVQTEPAQRFNRMIAAGVMNGEGWNWLASPGSGAGVVTDFVDMASVHAHFEGLDDPLAAARAAWPAMARTGRRLLRDGVVVQDQAANEAELAARIEAFRATRLPVLQGLGVA